MVEKLNHIIEAQQFSRSFLESELFIEAAKMEVLSQRRDQKHLSGKMVYNLFYEPSTRTRISFETAVTLLGGTVFGTDNALNFSSAVKGETLEDTVRVINSYGYDAIVLRYHEEGGAHRAARVSTVPIVNAGDGPGQHPTQALLDVYTIWEKLKSLDDLRVVMVGDLTYGRTVHSLAYLLAKFKNTHLDFVAPRIFSIKQEIVDYLDRHNVSYTTDKSLDQVLPVADVVYVTRAQTERFKHGEKFGANGSYVVNLEALGKLPLNSIIMHPLPRNEELPPEVDSDPRIVCFRQAQNGLYVRMALLRMILT